MDVPSTLNHVHYKSDNFRYNIKKLTSTSVIIFSSILMKVGNVNTFTTTTKTVKNAATAIKIMLK